MGNLTLKSKAKMVFWWLLALVLIISALAVVQQSRYLSELESEYAHLFRTASKRVVQHDAYTTTLAVAVDSDIERHQGFFLDIAKTINYYYPRVYEIQLVDVHNEKSLIGSRPLAPEAVSALVEATRQSTSMFTLLPHTTEKAHYFFIKRRPDSQDARYALSLGVDATRLIINLAIIYFA